MYKTSLYWDLSTVHHTPPNTMKLRQPVPFRGPFRYKLISRLPPYTLSTSYETGSYETERYCVSLEGPTGQRKGWVRVECR